MATRLSLPITIITVLLTGTAACGGDGDARPSPTRKAMGPTQTAAATAISAGRLSLQEYFQALQDLSDEVDEPEDPRAVQLLDDLEAAQSEQELVALYPDVAVLNLARLRDFIHGIDALEPPAEVEALHRRLEETGGSYLATVEELTGDLVDQLEAAESEAEAQRLFDGFDLRISDDEYEFGEVCFALERFAGEHDIQVMDREGGQVERHTAHDLACR